MLYIFTLYVYTCSVGCNPAAVHPTDPTPAFMATCVCRECMCSCVKDQWLMTCSPAFFNFLPLQSSCVTHIIMPHHNECRQTALAAPARPHGYKQTITSSTCKYTHAFTFKAAQRDSACQWPLNVTLVNCFLLWPEVEVSFMMRGHVFLVNDSCLRNILIFHLLSFEGSLFHISCLQIRRFLLKIVLPKFEMEEI